jgi:CubicO group peptidase (beta-lactamase class C family)
MATHTVRNFRIMIHSRRDFLKYSLLTLGSASMLAKDTFAFDDSPTPAERQAMRQTATAVMKAHAIPGLSVAIAHHGRPVYQEAFGFADKNAKEKAEPSQLFRIASVSKPITSAAIFTLIEQGHLKLDDVIFGTGGLLRGEFGEPPYKKWVGEIRLKHLLTHTAGGWTNDGNDPMFKDPKMNHKELITWTLKNQPLLNEPGTKYAYSNFGYCILGRLIEKVTKRGYAEFVKDAVLSKCGVTDMRIAGNTLAERARNEVVYYSQQGDGSPYEMNVRRMDSHGGWLATALDLVRFAIHVDGQSKDRDILRLTTIKEMTTPTTAGPDYAKGWAVNKYSNWWHTGALPGTSTIMVRTSSDLCWAALANTREAKGDTGGALDKMMWDVAKTVKSWKA